MLGLNSVIVNLSNRENVTIGERTVVRGIIRNEVNGKVSIGNDVYLGDDTLISCAKSIKIGDYSLIAHGVQIFDNDTHPLDPKMRQLHFDMIRGMIPMTKLDVPSRPVIVGHSVWIGMNSLIMKGVTIGDDTVVAAGSVVTRDLPGSVIASGNPAEPVRYLKKTSGDFEES